MKPDKGYFLANVGAVIAGVFSTACCLGPAVFAGLGIGIGATGLLAGAAGFVKSLIPYRPFFIVTAVGFMAWAFWKVYRSPGSVCAIGDPDTARRLVRQKWGLWIISAVASMLLLSPYWLEWL